ncbi:MAG: NrdH-redoxin [Chloroflexi bacterium]|nr:MAG: NrdH-redoxin [Chloroflexota bacterium]MBL1196031.1 NrdH-redoxin [Chloroflexota bacterium]NOH13325.1 NrdH-redoxin [Chloroflexota bacterium]
MTQSTPEKITLYGTAWCGDCHRSRLVLKKNEIDYVDIDIDGNKDAEQIVLEVNGGSRSVPTIIFPDGSTMTEPSRRELEAKLAEM